MENTVAEESKTEKENSEIPNEETNETENKDTAVLKLEQDLKKAGDEILSLKDSWARERAEFQNFKRRSAAEFLAVKREALKAFIVKLLDPLDNLERVSVSSSEELELKAFIDGVNMIQMQFISILEKENVFKMNCAGQPFDPMKMEAIASLESEDYNEETVIEVYQAGYEFRENNESVVLRPARVRIGRPKF
ncbi:MAG TPA: nucleotide exchange factor GrpE [Leptospiraceae bacterium]|nr:nucleotide exchange factor GrpE [Leptospiraceae bacterium]HNF26701.1 nucleotide exchange factor GrpE [Leptospiraceae bacterium]HNI96128.1 nucleotide exchange factor GrpE [Leptospiraceae bacterium]HNM05988.1 nucleotide exchange factor GrpE [Leptospiraceae bacterium]HNN06607.1 nucleotide exchange factor GrpE [Leptospiraceae bacterium]